MSKFCTDCSSYCKNQNIFFTVSDLYSCFKHEFFCRILEKILFLSLKISIYQHFNRVLNSLSKTYTSRLDTNLAFLDIKSLLGST